MNFNKESSQILNIQLYFIMNYYGKFFPDCIASLPNHKLEKAPYPRSVSPLQNFRNLLCLKENIFLRLLTLLDCLK